MKRTTFSLKTTSMNALPCSRNAKRYQTAAAIREKTRPLRYSVMTSCLIGETREDALDRARTLYGRRPREASFEDWLARLEAIDIVGSVEEAAERRRAYERAGADRMMLQHLLHTDLEPVRLIGRELAPALA